MSRIVGRPFRKGEPRPPGAGRRKGSQDKVPRTLKAVVDRFGGGPEGAMLFEQALRNGLRARPPHSAPYVKILADRVLGPVPKIPPDPNAMPLVIVLGQPLGAYDPLARRSEELPPPPIINVEKAEAAVKRAEAAPPRRPRLSLPAPEGPPPPPVDADLEVV